ncbi:hypothetical protein BJV78DRAFT_1182876 [Lactifluus subvellereus]|nr:hypothetical protein BJV78DRAFT_1182876 [Lactifluus subvellereus]
MANSDISQRYKQREQDAEDARKESLLPGNISSTGSPAFAFSRFVATTQSKSTSTHACHEMHRMGDVEMTTAFSSASCCLRLGGHLDQARPRQAGRCVTYPCPMPLGCQCGWPPTRRQYASPNVSDTGGQSHGYASAQQALEEHCQHLTQVRR